MSNSNDPNYVFQMKVKNQVRKVSKDVSAQLSVLVWRPDLRMTLDYLCCPLNVREKLQAKSDFRFLVICNRSIEFCLCLFVKYAACHEYFFKSFSKTMSELSPLIRPLRTSSVRRASSISHTLSVS